MKKKKNTSGRDWYCFSKRPIFLRMNEIFSNVSLFREKKQWKNSVDSSKKFKKKFFKNEQFGIVHKNEFSQRFG